MSHLGACVAAATRAMLTRARERAEPEQPAPQEIAVALRGGLMEDAHSSAPLWATTSASAWSK